MFDQRAVVEGANAKTKAARRNVQRRTDAARATQGDTPRAPKRKGGSVDYSKPVKPAKSEIGDD